METMETRLTAEQDRALAKLRMHGRVEFSSIKTVVELNAFRDLTKRGLARFGRFRDNCGYVLVRGTLLRGVR